MSIVVELREMTFVLVMSLLTMLFDFLFGDRCNGPSHAIAGVAVLCRWRRMTGEEAHGAMLQESDS